MCIDSIHSSQEPKDPNKALTALQQWNTLQELQYYKNSAAQVRVFQCLEMHHPECEGVQRVRCYPFPEHEFQGRNITDPVFFKPVDNYKSDFALPEDKDLLEFGRVQLLFSVLVPTKLGRHEEEDLVFIKYFKRYNVDGKPLS